MVMTSDDDDRSQRNSKAISFDTMSIEDLHEHIAELQAEIEKTKSVIEKKLAAQSTADNFFKK
jgi:uncharacterized small protein (DUF1192 family)